MLERTGETIEPIKLAHVAPFRLGSVDVIPATRQLVRDGRSETIEPRVMQVLVALARFDGAVVTRDELVDLCWDGRIVGENAINRVISRIRQIAAEFGEGSFEVETITKVGYRLLVAGVPSSLPPNTGDQATAARPAVSRRALLGGAALAMVGVFGGVMVWREQVPAVPKAARELYARGVEVRRGGAPTNTEQGIAYFREAVRIAPDFADAWGQLALAYRDAASWEGRSDLPALLARSRSAAAQALRLDPANPEARLTLITFQPMYRNWLRGERVIRAILADHPDHWAGRRMLGELLSGVGRNAEAAGTLQPLVAENQFSPLARYHYAYALWGAGRLEEAEAALRQAVERWPKHGAIWQAHVKFLAHTGRPAAAMALLQDPSSRPIEYEPDIEQQVRVVRALQTRSHEDVDRALEALDAHVRRSQINAVNAMQYVASLGRVDEAFALAEGFFLGRGRWAASAPPPDFFSVTALLFNPLTAPMRADPRFVRLTRETGLEDYWRRSGTQPDYRRRI